MALPGGEGMNDNIVKKMLIVWSFLAEARIQLHAFIGQRRNLKEFMWLHLIMGKDIK